jgi:PEP-CTERM motif
VPHRLVLNALLLSLAAGAPAGASVLYGAFQDGGANGVSILQPDLSGQINVVLVGGTVTGLAARGDHDFYVNTGTNTIDEFSDTGVLLHSVTGAPDLVGSDLSFGGSVVYAAFQEGAASAVAILLPDLSAEIGVVTVSGTVTGLAAGANNDFYVNIGGDTIDEFSDSGALLHSIAGPSNLVGLDLSLGGDVLYAAFQEGGANAVALLMPDLSSQIGLVTLGGTVTGLSAGAGNDFYVNIGSNTIFDYSNSGTLLHQISGDPNLVGLDLSLSPVPEPASILLVATALLGIAWVARHRPRARF